MSKSVEMRFIKNTPDNKIGDVTNMTLEGAQMYVDEGVTEYTSNPEISKIKTTKKLEIEVHKNEQIKFREDYFKSIDKTILTSKQLDSFSTARFEFNNVKKDKQNLQEELTELLIYYDELKSNLEVCSADDYIKMSKELKQKESIRTRLINSIHHIELNYILDNVLEVYLLQSEITEVFLLVDTHKKTYIKFNRTNLLTSIKLLMKQLFSSTPAKMSSSQLIDYLANNNYLKSVYDVGYYPNSDTKIFSYSGKTYFNEYTAGLYEIKKSSYKKLNHDNIKDLHTKLNFPLISKLIKHLTGDKRVFYTSTIELLTGDNKDLIKDELKHLRSILNLPNGEIKDIVDYCTTHLNELTPSEIKIYEDNYFYFLNWLSYIFNNPTKKIPTSCCFKTTPGAGKDFFLKFVLDNLFGSQNNISIGQNDLAGLTNGWLVNSRLVICNELQYSKEHAMVYENLKRWSSNLEIAVREMYKSQRMVQNFAHFLFFSNNDNFMKVEKNDRRYTIYNIEYPVPALVPYSLSPTLDDTEGKQLNPHTLNKELEEFTKFLNSNTTTYSIVSKPHETEFKTDVVDFHKQDYEIFIESFTEFSNITDMIKYYNTHSDSYKLDETNMIQYLDSVTLQSELIPNNILFDLFKCVCKSKGWNTRRGERSLFKILGQYPTFKGSKKQRYEVTKQSLRMKYLSLMPFNKEIVEEPKPKQEETQSSDPGVEYLDMLEEDLN